MAQCIITDLNVHVEEWTIEMLYHLRLLLELIQELQARGDQMTASETCGCGCGLRGASGSWLLLRLESLLELHDDLLDHNLRSDWALMRQVKAKIDRGFAHFRLKITSLANGVLHETHQVCLDLIRLQVSKEDWECFLNEFKQAEVILEIWVFETLGDKL